jgi:hypothetical protein
MAPGESGKADMGECSAGQGVPGLNPNIVFTAGRGYYCVFSYGVTSAASGPPPGYGLGIAWTSADGRFYGRIYQDSTLSDEGTSYRPTAAMLGYQRTLWHDYA